MTKNLSRRDFFKTSGIFAAATALAACQPSTEVTEQTFPTLAPVPDSSPAPLPAETLDDEALLRHTLKRISFGVTPAMLAHARSIGLDAYIEEQLSPEKHDNTALEKDVSNFATLSMTPKERFELEKYAQPIVELIGATLLRQWRSESQLYEVMADFWTNHFNIYLAKNPCRVLKADDDRDVIRAHTFGKFAEILSASAHSPAMLTYLDQATSTKRAPNENYAREVMELHSLGVEGGYAQQDVMELARCLTGWTMKEHFWRGDFHFDEDVHDSGVKKVLGMNIPAGGLDEAERVIRDLGLHPSTAHFLGFKLCRRFIADEPPAALVSSVAERFTATNGDIHAVMQTLLTEGIPHIQPKFKRPADFIISALRQLDARTDGGAPLQKFLARMGQPYFTWPTPDGYPDTSAPWMSNLMPRWQFAAALAQNEIKGTSIDVENLLAISGTTGIESFTKWASTLLLGAPLPEEDCQKMASALRAAGAGDEISTARVVIAGLLASPAFQWK